MNPLYLQNSWSPSSRRPYCASMFLQQMNRPLPSPNPLSPLQEPGRRGQQASLRASVKAWWGQLPGRQAASWTWPAAPSRASRGPSICSSLFASSLLLVLTNVRSSLFSVSLVPGLLFFLWFCEYFHVCMWSCSRPMVSSASCQSFTHSHRPPPEPSSASGLISNLGKESRDQEAADVHVGRARSQ